MSRLVYFSSVSNNTERFADRLDEPSVRIPLRPRIEPMITVDEPYVLMLPTYGGGAVRSAVPKQVLAFLRHHPAHRELVRGIISSGNTNFGTAYCLAGRVLSAKLAVPELYRFELLGTPEDVTKVNAGLSRFWTTGQAEQISLARASYLAARAAATTSPTAESPDTVSPDAAAADPLSAAAPSETAAPSEAADSAHPTTNGTAVSADPAHLATRS